MKKQNKKQKEFKLKNKTIEAISAISISGFTTAGLFFTGLLTWSIFTNNYMIWLFNIWFINMIGLVAWIVLFVVFKEEA